jgi:type IV secretory pathway VirB2 component (pilin)
MKTIFPTYNAGLDFQTKLFVGIFFCFLFSLLFPSNALAQALPPGGLPWESATRNIACQLGGATLRWLAVISIVLAGIMFGLGELSGPFQRFMQIAGGFSIAISAVSVVGWLLGTGPGACPAGA